MPEGKECPVDDEFALPSAGPDPLPWDTALAHNPELLRPQGEPAWFAKRAAAAREQLGA